MRATGIKGENKVSTCLPHGKEVLRDDQDMPGRLSVEVTLNLVPCTAHTDMNISPCTTRLVLGVDSDTKYARFCVRYVLPNTETDSYERLYRCGKLEDDG